MQRKRFLIILIGIVSLAVLGVIIFLVISFQKGTLGTNGIDGFSLFPGGSNTSINNNNNETPETNNQENGEITTEQNIPRLRKLANFPVTAVALYTRPETITLQKKNIDPASPETEIVTTENILAQVPYARYTRQNDGAVFTTKIGNILNQTQTSVGTIPYAGDVVIANNGNTILYRFYNENRNTLETFMTTIPEPFSPFGICGASFSPDNITELSEAKRVQSFLSHTLNQTMVIDGVLGSGTKKLLETFQKNNSLPVTGAFDLATSSGFNNICINLIEEYTRAQKPINLDGVFLPENIVALAKNPDSTKITYAAKQNNNTLIMILDIGTKSLRQIFSSPFSEWKLSWTTENKVTMTTKPSGRVPGFIYHVDTENTAFRKIADDTNGIIGITNHDGTKLFFTEQGNTMKTYLLDFITGEKTPFQIETTADKCVWSQKTPMIYCAAPDFIERGLYPDDWYKGNISFQDSLWKIDTISEKVTQISALLDESGEVIDVIKPSLDTDENYMVFINKTTGEPWLFDLTQ